MSQVMEGEDEISPIRDEEPLLFPEIARPGTCGTCHWARFNRNTRAWRCAKHDVPTQAGDSCADYVPAPSG